MLHLFSPTLCWAVSAATAYGWIFLWPDYRATLYRPVPLSPEGLHVRSGLVADFTVPRANLLSAEQFHGRPRRARHRHRLTGMARANVRVRLSPGTTLRMPWGMREVTEVVLGVDEPAPFMAALRATLPAAALGAVPAQK